MFDAVDGGVQPFADEDVFGAKADLGRVWRGAGENGCGQQVDVRLAKSGRDVS